MNDIAMTEEQVVELIEELKQASQLYYLEGEQSPLSDEEFDAKQEFLKNISETTPEFSHLFKNGSTGAKILEGDVLLGAEMIESKTINSTIVHKTPMLSLAKAKKETELESYINKLRKFGETDFRLQAKLDGTAISVCYEKGELSYIATRGNGTVGEDITYIHTDKNVSVIGLPHTIALQETVEIRGEMFMTDEQFKKANENRNSFEERTYELSRSAVSGILKRSKKNMPYEVEMTFGAYSVWQNNELLSLESIDEQGFTTVDDITEDHALNVQLTGFKNNEQIHKAIEDFGKIKEGFDFPIDGVVIKPVHEAALHSKMGNTSHHPASQIAWKYPAEKAQTVVENIICTVGKSGRITPVALFEEVVLDGSKLTKASLHNFKLVYKKDVRIGSAVIIEKANQVIPQIVSVITHPENSARFEVPEVCPACGEKLSYEGESYPPKTLTCDNDFCSAKAFEILVSAVHKNRLDIDGLDHKTLKPLYDQGIVSTIADLYSLNKDDLSKIVVRVSEKGNPVELGVKRAEHILEHIEQSKTLPLERLIDAFGINSVGRRASKKLVDHFTTLPNIQTATIEDIAGLDGFSYITAEKIVNGLNKRKDMIQEMTEKGVVFDKEETNDKDLSVSDNNNGSILQGLSFSISGTVPSPFANRNEWVDYVEQNGGEFHSSPKSATSFMIAEKDGSSSKIKKALSLNIEFLTADEFTDRFVQ